MENTNIFQCKETFSVLRCGQSLAQDDYVGNIRNVLKAVATESKRLNNTTNFILLGYLIATGRPTTLTTWRLDYRRKEPHPSGSFVTNWIGLSVA